HGPGHGRGPGGPGGWGQRGPGFDGETLAKLLNIDVQTLRSDLRDGKTIAQIASDQGVDVQTVIDGLVAEAKTHLDQAVQHGRLTQHEADAKLTKFPQTIPDLVNNGFPKPPAPPAQPDTSSSQASA